MLRPLTLPAILAIGLIAAAPAAAQEIGVSISVGQATRNLSHDWSVAKTGSTVSGLAGDTLPGATWTVSVSETAAGSSFVSASLLIKNLTLADLPLSVSAVMDDGSVLTLDSLCPPALKAGREVTCSVKGDVGNTASVLVVTVNLGSHSLTESVSLNFTGSNSGGSAVLTDTILGVVVLNQTLTAGQGPWTFTLTDNPFHCQTQERGLFVNGEQISHIDNTAFLEIAGGEKAGATAEVTYICRAGFVDLVKRTNGVPNPTYNWEFPLFLGPDGYTPDWANLVSGVQSSIDPDGDGVLPFNEPLNPTKTYSLCEVNLPSGWSATWQINGQAVTPYNPDADNNPPEDLGNRCVDIGANTPYSVSIGGTISVSIDNRSPDTPGGQPRTPGYWKTWNRCTTGGQALNADRQALRAGYSAGEGWRVDFWLVEDVLNAAVGGGVTWDDIQADALLVPIDSCEEAVEILDTRIVNVNGSVGDGKKLASDAARNLARNLLAAQFNLAAGACTTQAALDAAAAAEALLDGINFDGTSTEVYLKSGALASQALALAGILDNYNNGNFCGNGQ